MRTAAYCEVNFPLYKPNAMTKRVPLPKHEVFDLPEFHKALHEAIPKGKKYVIDVLAKRLSQRGEFTDYFDRFPDDWNRFEEMRGREFPATACRIRNTTDLDSTKQYSSTIQHP